MPKRDISSKRFCTENKVLAFRLISFKTFIKKINKLKQLKYT